MSAEDPKDRDREDWELLESSGDVDPTTRRALKDLERIAAFSRGLQRTETAQTGASPGTGGPDRWGHLMLLERVGAGAQGEVWRAWDATLQRQVALKFLQPRPGGPASDLLGEARALARLRHPGIVAVYGVAEHEGRAGMWMEWVEGLSLGREVERRGSLPARDVARIGVELCSALEALEGAGVVHRDIKPANVIMETGGRVVLTDFGLGWRPALDDTKSPRTSGTPIFMAPEVLAGGEPGPRSDLYALGVTLWWALAGRSPFRAQTFDELRDEAARGPATPLRRARSDAPQALTEAIQWAMKPEPRERPQSAGPLREKLALALPQGLERAGASPIARALAGPWWKLGVALLGLAGLGLWIASGIRSLVDHAAPHWTARMIAAPQAILDNATNECSLSPDGTRIAYLADSGTVVSVLTIDSNDTRTVDRLHPGEGAYSNVTWTSDGLRLAAARWDPIGGAMVVTVDPITGHREVLARLGGLGKQETSDMRPTLSPDERFLAVRSGYRPETGAFRQLSVMDLRSGNSRELVQGRPDESVIPAAWDPGSARLAYVVERGMWQSSRIETCDLQGKRETVTADSSGGFVATGSAERRTVQWLDARHLLYAHRPDRNGEFGNAEWWIVALDDAGRASSPPRLAYALPGAEVYEPSPSRHDRVAFIGERSLRSVKMIGTDGRSRYVELANGAQLASLRYPEWSPDGKALLVRSDKVPEKPTVGRLDLSDGHYEPLAPATRFQDRPLRVTPDGRAVLCQLSSKLVSVPLVGGTPRVLADSFAGTVLYATAAGRWLSIEQSAPDLVVRDFSPDRGLGPVRFRYAAPGLQPGRVPYADLSPDGTRLVVVRGDASGYDILDANTGRIVSRIPAPGASIPQSVSWGAGGIYATGIIPDSGTFWVAHLSANGVDRTIWQSPSVWAGSLVVSPDGSTLAFVGLQNSYELWLLERS